MSAPIVAFFNNKGGVGKTSLVYHLAWILQDGGTRVVAADLDPQANLSAAFLDEDRIEDVWNGKAKAASVFTSLTPLIERTGALGAPRLEQVAPSLALLVGDLNLSEFEDELSLEWPRCLNGDKGAFQVMSAFWQILRRAAESHRADIVLLDLGPNLGTINRAALIAADYVVVPLTPDLFSLQGLRNLGPRLRRWREDWRKRLSEAGRAGVSFDLPEGNMTPIGYVVLQHAVRLDRPTKAYDEWIKKIPTEYRESVLGQAPSTRTSVANDPECLALLKHYRSLMPLAQEARKPIFHLTAADGALGAHYQATADVRSDFKALATKIAKKANPT